MSKLYVWQLQFDGEKGLEHAFQSLMDADDLEDCSAEPEALQIRFTAGAERGQELVSAIYLMGELRWCSRHRLSPGGTIGQLPHAALR